MTGERHCGYANYETFTVAVVIDNDRKLYTESRAVVAKLSDEMEYQFEIADGLRLWVEERFIDPVCQEGTTHHGIAATLCNSALGQVDWLELVHEFTKGDDEQ